MGAPWPAAVLRAAAHLDVAVGKQVLHQRAVGARHACKTNVRSQDVKAAID